MSRSVLYDRCSSDIPPPKYSNCLAAISSAGQPASQPRGALDSHPQASSGVSSSSCPALSEPWEARLPTHLGRLVSRAVICSERGISAARASKILAAVLKIDFVFLGMGRVLPGGSVSHLVPLFQKDGSIVQYQFNCDEDRRPQATSKGTSQGQSLGFIKQFRYMI